ncbi:60S ribosomal protein L7ae/L30e, putative [Plasmodium ovale wallikeri]|uniref:60S ribosomal protein L7ae/L30e, putative n=1 Tax=Plasmodium ovale wallikeri TaxID=864142 RepID=A0A1A8YLH2_PLAOA|nr:60S ribosomal protein L7ae/L30e, putative [Plasmodium ovale wallikeri]
MNVDNAKEIAILTEKKTADILEHSSEAHSLACLPLCRFAALPLCRFADSPIRRFTALPLYRFTALPPYRLTALPPYRLTTSQRGNIRSSDIMSDEGEENRNDESLAEEENCDKYGENGENTDVSEHNKGKTKKSYDKVVEEIKRENGNCHMSKISEPLLKKRYYKYFLKMLDYIYYAKISAGHIIKTNGKLEEKKKKILKTQLIGIGLNGVIKAIRKGIQGIVILAIDVFPIDIISHIPVFCEEHNVPYTFVTTKNKLAHLCKLKRAITCLFIYKPNDNFSHFEKLINQYNCKQKIKNYAKLYDKLQAGLKKNHPFFLPIGATHTAAAE